MILSYSPLAPPHTSPDLTSLLPNLMYFFYCLNNMPSSINVAQILTGVGPSTGVWSTYPGHALKGKKRSTINNFLVRDGSS